LRSSPLPLMLAYTVVDCVWQPPKLLSLWHPGCELRVGAQLYLPGSGSGVGAGRGASDSDSDSRLLVADGVHKACLACPQAASRVREGLLSTIRVLVVRCMDPVVQALGIPGVFLVDHIQVLHALDPVHVMSDLCVPLVLERRTAVGTLLTERFRRCCLHSPTSAVPARCEVDPASGSTLCMEWFRDGKLHRKGDLPAQVVCSGQDTKMVWFANGRQHRDGARKPALVSPFTLEFYHQGHRVGHQTRFLGDLNANGEVCDDPDWLPVRRHEPPQSPGSGSRVVLLRAVLGLAVAACLWHCYAAILVS